MRKITFKNRTTRNRKRRDIWMQEVNDENGMHAEIQKRCVFLVQNHRHLPNLKAVEQWVTHHMDDPRCRLRNLTVTRRENTQTGTKDFYFKAIGNFYAVMGEDIFSVGFVQTYEVHLTSSRKEGGEAWT